jgi:rod shape-determining protein MreD
MMKRDPRPPISRGDTAARALWLAPVTIMLGSLVTIVPFVASYPTLPPFGLMMLLAWRMRRPDLFRSWAPLPLGLFDDLVSGQPLGSAMLIWTLANLAMDILETRLVWRDMWQDWAVAAAMIAAALIAGRLIAVPIGTHVDTALLVQIVVAIGFYPLVARLTAALDRRGVTA